MTSEQSSHNWLSVPIMSWSRMSDAMAAASAFAAVSTVMPISWGGG